MPLELIVDNSLPWEDGLLWSDDPTRCPACGGDVFSCTCDQDDAAAFVPDPTSPLEPEDQRTLAAFLAELGTPIERECQL